MYPFIKEHTSYGAIIGLYIPASFALAFLGKSRMDKRAFALFIFLIVATGLVLSYTRAAWVSVAASLGVMVLLLLRIRSWSFWLLTAAVAGGVLLNLDPIIDRLSTNNQDSSDDLGEHVESISNISTDASKSGTHQPLEFRFEDVRGKALVGFGPGTYQFKYAPYQNPHQKTIISTNNGDVGNAHSEYIGPLAEQGLPGMLLVLLFLFILSQTAVRVIYRSRSPSERLLATALFMGLVSYFTHGLLNNFLDMDKAAVPVWGFSAALVMMDLGRIRWSDDESSD